MRIIPFPAQYERHSGYFSLRPDTQIAADPSNRINADYLRTLLAKATGFRLPISSADQIAGQNFIQLCMDPGYSDLGQEGYLLEVSQTGVTITASAPAGVFYGIQSFRQLLPVEIENPQPVQGIEWQCPCVKITDQPRFAWRGFMLDEGRHFHGKQAVLQILDVMALHKLNIFHWHLTEDQGWRIEIARYPRLTEIGSHRPGTGRSMFGRKHDGIPHGGFYSQAEIREVVAYAAERHIQIVPEIELPGHSQAALAAYPELSCTGGPFEVATHFGIFPDIYCAGKEATFVFLQNVLGEILELFPSPWIHIGGDEAPKSRWKKCPDCQKRISTENLKDEHALQAYFTNRVAHFLEARGRTIIGWNQILHPGLLPGAVAQYWVGGWKKLIQAIRAGHRPVIMSSYLDTYLDHSYSLMPLSRAYHYDPVPAELAAADRNCILGLEFPLWGEWLPSRERLHFQAFPRLCALAETGWSPGDRKDWNGFLLRLGELLPRLDLLGIRYASLKTAEPARWKRVFGIFTIPIPQTGTASQRQSRKQIQWPSRS